ncbi:putative protein serine/threonine phosphatase 2C [Chloropicon primus]|nr:putative protein serine/threonine phosphatase 2C [Chloropicon primus]UPQ97539.1 putative protein serine/threonine phosphatase 2C [Chloropicon primus]|eukprot:QDZ18328.1 putative protein serine/threonine phosphatase 2C [Chloropicon primus]
MGRHEGFTKVARKNLLRVFGGGSGVSLSQRTFWRGAGVRATAASTNVLRSATGSSRFGGKGVSNLTACNAASVGSSTTQSVTELEFYTGGAMYPSAEKTNGGEDSYFVTFVSAEDGMWQSTSDQTESDESIKARGFLMMGVSDGVGGWAQTGVNAGHYSRQLMQLSSKFSKEENPANPNPKRVLYNAVAETDKKGSATVCIVSLSPSADGANLRAANLGDSGFLVVREKQVAFVSPIQQHSFNFPFQVSSIPQYSDSPMKAETFDLAVQPGDTVILASDGLLDNLYPDEMATIVYQAKANGTPPGELAHILAKITLEVASDPKRDTPFANGARQVGFPHEIGGKMDDVTVVVSYVQQGSKL